MPHSWVRAGRVRAARKRAIKEIECVHRRGGLYGRPKDPVYPAIC